jgi:hypothetical protein
MMNGNLRSALLVTYVIGVSLVAAGGASRFFYDRIARAVGGLGPSYDRWCKVLHEGGPAVAVLGMAMLLVALHRHLAQLGASTSVRGFDAVSSEVR